MLFPVRTDAVPPVLFCRPCALGANFKPMTHLFRSGPARHSPRSLPAELRLRTPRHQRRYTEEQHIYPGIDPSTYAVFRRSTQRNVYRIPLQWASLARRAGAARTPSRQNAALAIATALIRPASAHSASVAGEGRNASSRLRARPVRRLFAFCTPERKTGELEIRAGEQLIDFFE